MADWFVTTREEIEAYDLHLSYSKDEGRTWAAPFRAHRDRTQTQHGFATLFEMPDKRLGLVWLDGRDMETTKDPQGGVMALRFTSFDSSWTHAADVPVNVRVCECCQTAAVVTADGVLTAFRDRSEKEIRDIAVSRLDNGSWTDARIVHADNFETDSCPVNGPSLSARGRDVAVAWFAPTENDGHAFAAFSHDAGRTWSAPTRLDDRQSLGYTDIELLEDGSAVATWVEFADQRRQLAMRHIDALRQDVSLDGDRGNRRRTRQWLSTNGAIRGRTGFRVDGKQPRRGRRGTQPANKRGGRASSAHDRPLRNQLFESSASRPLALASGPSLIRAPSA